MTESPGWKYATYGAVGMWLVLGAHLMIADVWDETNGMLAFSDATVPLLEKLSSALTTSLGFWRPLPTLVGATLLHYVPDFDESWRLLRALNMAMILATLSLFCSTLELAGVRRLIFTLALLFSGSAFIAAGWYTTIFDASALLLIAVALSRLSRGREIEAGVILGIAIFCKESAALAIPFLLALIAAGHITFKQGLRASVPAGGLALVYFALRAMIIPFGGEGDIHGFGGHLFLPTLVGLAESFWRQTLKEPDILGFFWLALSFAALRDKRLIGAAALFLCATAAVYWGMLSGYQNGVLLHHLNFVGRLFLVPVSLMLFLLASARRTVVMAVLLIPIVLGGYVTWRDHARFQETYRRIYRVAAETSEKPLTVHFPPKPLEDEVRGVRIGNLPRAMISVDARTGDLSYR